MTVISSYSAKAIVTSYSNFEAKKSFIIKEIQKKLPNKNTITYTEVPRGIILSIAQTEIFDENSDNISENGKILLLHIANLLNTFNNNCTIEVHNENIPYNGTSISGKQV